MNSYLLRKKKTFETTSVKRSIPDFLNQPQRKHQNISNEVSPKLTMTKK